MGFFDGAAGGIIGGSIGAIGSLIGGKQSSNNAQALANMNYEAQKEFAQNGIRWKVADAEAAGIHPLYALGASTNSYSPVSGYGGDNGISDAFSQLGNGFSQGFDRAMQAKMTKEERDIAEAQLERQEVLQLADFNLRKRESDARVNSLNASAYRDYAAARVALTNQQQVPAMPGSPTLLPGQGDAPPSGTKEAPYWDKSIPTYGFVHNARGVKTEIIPSDPLAQRTEDKAIIEWMPWVKSTIADIGAKYFGREVDGYWWHGDDKGYLPYPPEKKGNFNAVKWARSRGGYY